MHCWLVMSNLEEALVVSYYVDCSKAFDPHCESLFWLFIHLGKHYTGWLSFYLPWKILFWQCTRYIFYWDFLEWEKSRSGIFTPLCDSHGDYLDLAYGYGWSPCMCIAMEDSVALNESFCHSLLFEQAWQHACLLVPICFLANFSSTFGPSTFVAFLSIILLHHHSFHS